MNNQNILSDNLLNSYRSIKQSNSPEWAVHKKSSPDELVSPTIPFVGKQYLGHSKKILVYASAENLSNYHIGYNDRDWLDDDKIAENRHRWCFDNEEFQGSRKLPYVHLGPMEDGGLLTAVMYIAEKLCCEPIKSVASFYESIAFGNFGKYSIETELQKRLRLTENPTSDTIKALTKELRGKASNKDYAKQSEYLLESFPYIRADIEILKPDYIIMPNVSDNGFIDSIKGHAKIIRISQINGTVINNIAPNKKNNYCSKYTKLSPSELSPVIHETYKSIKGINLENYLYLFGHLDDSIKSISV